MKTDFFIGTLGQKLHYRAWESAGSPKAHIVIVHGYAEHGDRYAELAGSLSSQGFYIWAADHYGHGQSAGLRADVPRFELFAEDLSKFIDQVVLPETKNTPLFLYGHSMGGAIALLYSLEHQENLRGVILSGPLLRPGRQSSSLEKKAAVILKKILPTLPFRPFSATLLSHDRSIVRAYRADPLVYNGKMRLRMGAELLRVDELLPDGRLADLKLPLLLLHGGADAVVPPGDSEQLYAAAGSSDKTLRIFDGAYHEIHNESCKEELMELLLSWLTARL